MIYTISLELENGTIIRGIPRKNPRQLSLQIGNNNYFSFWKGKLFFFLER
jgi:hypothetical protein